MRYSFDGKQPDVGMGTYISETAMVIGDVRIGEQCYIGHGAILRGDYGTIIIGSGTAVEEGVIVHAPPNETCTIGNKVTIGHGAVIHSKEIEDLAVIGMGAVTSLWSKIGARSIVAEGAVVKMKQEIPSDVVAGGNPARVIRNIEPRDTERWAWGKQLYIDLAGKYLKIGMHKLLD